MHLLNQLLLGLQRKQHHNWLCVVHSYPQVLAVGAKLSYLVGRAEPILLRIYT